MIDPATLNRLKELLAKRLGLPWKVSYGYRSSFYDRIVGFIYAPFGKQLGSNDIAKINTDFGEETTRDINTLIVEAANNLPALIAAAETNAQLRAALEPFAAHPCSEQMSGCPYCEARKLLEDTTHE